MEDVQREFFSCRCGSLDHIFVMDSFKDEEETYVSIKLNTRGFFTRIKIALNYIFKPEDSKSSYPYAEVILDKDETKRLAAALQKRLEELS